MNIIHAGNRYQIYGEEVKTYKRLPAGTYQVRFHPMEGFSLSQRNDLSLSEEKVYGPSPAKAEKALKSYQLSNRNFGVLLSGQKGIGKSLFVRLLAEKAQQMGYPVITVSEAVPGIANYISSIDQDCIVIFDEFEKTFINAHGENQQDELLPLFDGMDGGHKLFIVTCNDLNQISQFMINRPGRFHYHFTMTPPSPKEVEEYLQDKLLPECCGDLQAIVNFSNVVDVPYDWLRAIVFEINQGYSFREAMQDLNITKKEKVYFNVAIFLSNGMRFEAWDEPIDLNKNDRVRVYVRRFEKDIYPAGFSLTFIPSSAQIADNGFVVRDLIDLSWDEYDFRGTEEENTQLEKTWNESVRVTKMVLMKSARTDLFRYEV